MKKKHFIIATAGHVDHGKSTLVKALTGTDPDRLPEEKARGITIDLGFAELNLTPPNGDKIHAGVVDVPGHEDFVRNMIAGVGSIDLALFVVAADDGWMPQTEEHLQILTYLGVKRAVIALTKCDLGRIDIVTAQIHDRLRETPFARSLIIVTSTRTGDGIENVKSALAAELADMQPQRDYGKARLFVDRVFTLHGIGTVVTGTLTGGQLQRGQIVSVQPESFEARIRSIQSHGSDLESAQPGMRTAINLPDVAPGQIKRGDVLTSLDLGLASSTLMVLIEKSSRRCPMDSFMSHMQHKTVPTGNAAACRLRNGISVYLHHGTSRVVAKVAFLEDTGLARLRLASPVFAFLGDRFVLRDPSEQYTIAGGVIVDPEGTKSLPFSAEPDAIDICLRSEIEERGFVQKKTLLRKSHFSTSEIVEALGRLERANEIVTRGGIVADTNAWKKLRDQATVLIDLAHKRNPERAGLDLNELRTELRNLPGQAFEALISDLCANKFVRKGSTVARAAHHAALPRDLEAVATRIRGVLSATAFDPPARKEIESDQNAQQVLRFMIDKGEVIEVGADVILLRDNLERMKSRVIDFISKNGPATVSELRQALESSRRVMVPFLEWLDREGVTRRVGDKRILAGQIAAVAKTGLD